MTIPAPYSSPEQQVQEGWIDYNGHMNVGYYGVAFDLGFDPFLDELGLTVAYRDSEMVSTFTVESHITYQGELMRDERFRVETQVVGYDEKRLHIFQRLIKTSDDSLSATVEWMVLHMDMKTRRVAPWKPEMLENIRDWYRAHKSLGSPAELNRVIGIKNQHD